MLETSRLLRGARLLALLAILSIIWTLVVWLTDGFTIAVGALRVSAHDWIRPLAVAFVSGGLAWWMAGRHALLGELRATWTWIARSPWLTVLLMAAAVFVAGITLNARVAGSADAYGYLSQARLWRTGQLHVEVPLARAVDWPDAEWTLAPIGFRPSPRPAAIVPIYAPGLPILMAGAASVHEAAEHWIVPMAGALLVVVAFVFGRDLRDARTGVFTAALMATSPAFLFFLMWPMSDVPVAAAWGGSFVLLTSWGRPRRWLLAGLLTSVALMIRPNMAPVAAAIAIGVLIAGPAGVSLRQRLLKVTIYSIGALPACLAIAWLHTHLYGSPVRSGYGSLGDLYRLENGPRNATTHVTSFVTSETPVVLLAVAGCLWAWRSPERRGLAVRFALLGVAVWSCYLFWQPLGEWWYLRFLLTAFPVVLALTAAGLGWWLERLSPTRRVIAAALIGTVVLAARLDFARRHGAFAMADGESRYVSTAYYVTGELPANAAFISMQQSGSLRYYADRLTIRWDALDPAWLERAIATLERLGYQPYFLLEEGEVPAFRARFARHGRLGDLQWDPAVTIRTRPVVRIYDPRDCRCSG